METTKPVHNDNDDDDSPLTRLGTVPKLLVPRLLDARLLLLPHRGVLLELATAGNEVDLGEGDDLRLVDELVPNEGEDVDGNEDVVLLRGMESERKTR